MFNDVAHPYRCCHGVVHVDKQALIYVPIFIYKYMPFFLTWVYDKIEN